MEVFAVITAGVTAVILFIFGSNIGTTVTAQLVAFKLTNLAPWLIILGFVLSLLHNRLSIFGKSIFYFGFVFFTLNLISNSLAPLQENEVFLSFLLGLENAIPLIMGANIGTTVTAFIAVFNMDIAAKKTAFTHFLFNVGGVAIFAPIILLFSDWLVSIDMDPEIVLASVHLVFNLATSILFIVLINPFMRFVDSILGEGKGDFERVGLPAARANAEFDEIRRELNENFIELKSDILLLIRELAGQTLALFDEIHKSIIGDSETNISATARDLQRLLDRVNRDMLKMLAQEGRRDAGSLTNFVTYSIRLKDKLVNFAHIEATHTTSSPN